MEAEMTALASPEQTQAPGPPEESLEKMQGGSDAVAAVVALVMLVTLVTPLALGTPSKVAVVSKAVGVNMGGSAVSVMLPVFAGRVKLCLGVSCFV